MKVKKDNSSKLIKVKGNSGLTRTSQACDRCRIKKIKCDGKVPSCSNCIAIGFNCKTSDKLTRRAFPRGYTESLEKNLISLQNENSNLLDEIEKLKAGKRSDSIDINNNTNDLQIKNETEFNPHINNAPITNNIDESENENNLTENFFIFDNFIQNNSYIGLNSLESSFNSFVSSNFKQITINDITEPKVLKINNIYEFLIDKFLIKFPSKLNLDLLISNHFENLNNLIPILDEDLFFKSYKFRFNLIENKTENLQILLENGLTKEFENEEKEDNLYFIINLILIVQLNCSIFSINDIHNLISNLNFYMYFSVEKFQTILLSLYLFQNKNCFKLILINLNNLSYFSVLNLGLYLNFNNLVSINKKINQIEKFEIFQQRIKLYWSFKILSNLVSIRFGLPIIKFFDKFHVPKLNSILNSNKNLIISINLIKLLDYFQNLNILSNYSNYELSKFNDFLNDWRFNSINSVDELLSDGKQENNDKNLNKIQINLFYYNFKILINLNNSINNKDDCYDENDESISKLSMEFLNLIIFLNSENEFNNLNNFEFHLIPINFSKMILISILNLIKFNKNLNDKGLIITLINLIKIRYPETFKNYNKLISLIKFEYQINQNFEHSDISISNSGLTLDLVADLNSNSNAISSNNDNFTFLKVPTNSLFSDNSNKKNNNTKNSISSATSSSYYTTTTAAATIFNDPKRLSIESDTSSIDELPSEINSNHLDNLLFDWNKKKTNTAYDLNYIIQK